MKYNNTGFNPESFWSRKSVERYNKLYKEEDMIAKADRQHDLEVARPKSERSEDAFSRQTGGSHYKKLAIQPMQYSLANNLNYAQANTIKYVTRYKDKNGIEDLKKAIHCIELLIEFEQNKGEE